MDTAKKRYYVSVQADSVLASKDDAVYEFEIEATDEEVAHLQRLFAGKEEADEAAFGRAHVPFLEYHHDQPNDDYDYYLMNAYKLIYELGTPTTKHQLERMNVDV